MAKGPVLLIARRTGPFAILCYFRRNAFTTIGRLASRPAMLSTSASFGSLRVTVCASHPELCVNLDKAWGGPSELMTAPV
ncbi:hypothetical protein HNR40_006890 [Nonomuraea endophytica]|uniref:Uncharacterized protein n=1 Tax=Nonomuraea endophytica TaxID=714136 RepID=A0A7W8AA09_9ACTN|nr:hypothetical protein [Nonomuraea endophytica]